MINSSICSSCSLEAASTCTCACSFNYCPDCLDSHSCPTTTASLAPRPDYLTALREQHALVLSYLSSFSSRFLDNPQASSKLISTHQLKNLIYLTFDSFPSKLDQHIICFKGNNLIIYDILNNRFEEILIPDYTPVLASSISYNTQYIFIVAGLMDFNPIDTIFWIDYHDTKQFGTLKLSQARYFSASACSKHYLFVVGGLDKEEKALDTIEWFDFLNGQKGVIAMSVGRKRPSVTVFNGKVYIAGEESKRSVDVLNIEDFSLTVEKLSWAKGSIRMISHYSGKLLVVGDKGITMDKSNVMLKTWNKLNDVWTQQMILGLDSFLYFFDYFTGEIMRIFIASFRSLE